MPGTPVDLPPLDYPGRLLSLGLSPSAGEFIALYAITGRSPSSQARRLTAEPEGVWVRPTDEEVLKQGNIDLLVYPSMLFGAAGLAVSNGRQTPDILGGLGAGLDPVGILSRALAPWDYEPDAPIFTPRISGCLAGGRAALSVIRRGRGGETLRSYFDVPLGPGKGAFISTYLGPNEDPLPCFEGEPRPIGLTADGPRQTAEALYAALGPRPGGRDLRVSVACAYVPVADLGALDVHIINRHERT